jgi:glycosyltransferase involved in cell wall biosynthesis
VVTHSASHRDHVAKQFGLEPTQIALVPHGIPVPPRTAQPKQDGGFNILFVGRMEQRKGIDLLLAALPTVLQGVPAATATLVGSDRDAFWENRWRKTAPPAVANRVTFAGVVADRALEQHYANAHVFVAPSRYESFGLIFVEAMARALPVVALRAPGAADLIDDNATGLLVASDDSDALAAALVRLATDSAARNRIGSAAHALVEKRYSLPVLAAASAELYRDVMRSRRPSRA